MTARQSVGSVPVCWHWRRKLVCIRLRKINLFEDTVSGRAGVTLIHINGNFDGTKRQDGNELPGLKCKDMSPGERFLNRLARPALAISADEKFRASAYEIAEWPA
jgi:hypothetical protein